MINRTKALDSVVIALWITCSTQAAELDDVLNAWRSRQARVDNLVQSWNASITESQLLLPQPPSPAPGKGRDLLEAVPPMARQVEFTLTIQGSKCRRDSIGPEWDGLDGRYVTNWEKIEVFNGQDNRRYDSHKSEANELEGSAVGVLDTRPKYNNTSNAFLLPLILHYRALDPVLSRVEVQYLQLSSNSGFVDSDECLIVSEASEGGTWHYWVVPKMDFVIRRYTYTTPAGIQTDTCDIDYERRTNEWIPISWESACYLDGTRLREAIRATNERVAINEGVAESLFEFEFPPATQVRQIGQDGTTVYVVRDDGSRELLFSRDATTRVQSNSGRAWTMAAVGCVVSITALLVVVRTVRRKNRRT